MNAEIIRMIVFIVKKIVYYKTIYLKKIIISKYEINNYLIMIRFVYILKSNIQLILIEAVK